MTDSNASADDSQKQPPDKHGGTPTTPFEGAASDARLANVRDAVDEKTLLSAGTIPTPESIGEYRILGVLGRGGMGVVYRAEQQNPRRHVALKVIGLSFVSPEVLRRFDLEVQTLGRLKHPGIAQVYEAGLVPTDHGAQPFFAMELIEGGTPLDRFAEEQKLNVKSRLELFARVCDAVQYAHQQGVIHRDLKPDNILVMADGQPKILDFGVARATDSDVKSATLLTGVGQIIGTLPYMSPEQAGGNSDEVDTRSDVYALGVIAYQLLAGKMPYDLARRALAEAVRVIREEEPSRLSSINRTYRGDIETIVSKALAKEKDRRYASANDLASDIRRYLKDEPITARPPGTWYQASKFARRNKQLVGGVLGVFLVLFAGVVVSARYAIEANQQRAQAVMQRDEATRSLARAETVTDLLKTSLVSSDPNQRGSQGMLVTEAMNQAIARLDSGQLKQQPDTEVNLRMLITYILIDNSRAADGLRQAEISLAMAKQLYGGDHPDVAGSYNNIGYALVALGRPQEAIAHYERSIAMYRRLYPGDSEHLASALGNFASALQALGRFEEAFTIFKTVQDTQKRMSTGEDLDVARTMNNVAASLKSLGRTTEALAKFEDVYAMQKRILPGDDPGIARSLNNIAACKREMGRADDALMGYQAALEMNQRLFSGDHPIVAASFDNVGKCLSEMGQDASALPKFEAALAMRKHLYDGDNTEVAQSLNNVATCKIKLGKYDGAGGELTAALEMRQRLFNGDHPDVASSMRNVAGYLNLIGQNEQALPLLESASNMTIRIYKGDHPEIADATNDLAYGLEMLGRSDQALEQFRIVLGMYIRIYGGDHPLVARSLNNVGGSLDSLGRYEEAIVQYRLGLAMRQRIYKGDHPEVAESLNNLAYCLRESGKYDEAMSFYISSYEMKLRIHGGDHPDIALALENLAFCRMSLGKTKEALQEFDSALKMRERISGGRETFDIAKSHRFVGNCLAALGRHDEALNEHLQSLSIVRQIIPPNDPRLIEAVAAVANAYRELRNWDAAEPLAREALLKRESIYGMADSRTCRSAFHLAVTLDMLKRADEAADIRKKYRLGDPATRQAAPAATAPSTLPGTLPADSQPAS